MASNGIAITPSHPPTVQAGQGNMGNRSYLGTVFGVRTRLYSVFCNMFAQ
jgi:hypothetical protein